MSWTPWASPASVVISGLGSDLGVVLFPRWLLPQVSLLGNCPSVSLPSCSLWIWGPFHTLLPQFAKVGRVREGPLSEGLLPLCRADCCAVMVCSSHDGRGTSLPFKPPHWEAKLGQGTRYLSSFHFIPVSLTMSSDYCWFQAEAWNLWWGLVAGSPPARGDSLGLVLNGQRLPELRSRDERISWVIQYRGALGLELRPLDLESRSDRRQLRCCFPEPPLLPLEHTQAFAEMSYLEASMASIFKSVTKWLTYFKSIANSLHWISFCKVGHFWSYAGYVYNSPNRMLTDIFCLIPSLPKYKYIINLKPSAFLASENIDEGAN